MPEIRIPTPEAYRSLGHPRLLITGYLKLWFAAHFASEVLIERPELRSYLWNESMSPPPNILVEDVLLWKPAATEQRPAILVKANAYRDQRWGVNDRMMGETALHRAPGETYYANGSVGSHTILGVSNLPAQAELLGLEIERELRQFGALIRLELGLHRLTLLETGEPFKVKEARENWAVPVTVGVVYQNEWKLYRHARFLTSVNTEQLI